MTTVESELQRTQKALAPGPKAVLAFSFPAFFNPPVGSSKPPVPLAEITLPILADGSVHVEFTVLNISDVDAVDGELTLQICDECRFAKEPEGFRKLKGQSDRARTWQFQRILARTSLQNMVVDVVPPRSPGFVIGIEYRCRTCVIPERPSTGVVRLIR